MASPIQTIRLLIGALLLTVCSTGYTATLAHCGEGDIKVRSKIVGQATLWMHDCKQPWQQQSIRLQFKYSTAIPAWAFKKAASVILARNLSDEAWQQGKKTFAEITQLYQPIKSGDVYQLDYDASSQTLVLSFNAQQQGKIQGNMTNQYFLIWFGDKPFSLALKKQLLG